VMRVAVAPLRYWAGIKGKVVTTMSHGLPGVVTSIAAEGLGLTAGEHTLVADSPAAIADAVVALYEQPALWNRPSRAGLDLVRERFGFDTGVPTVRALLESLDLRPLPGLAAARTHERHTPPWEAFESVRVASHDAYREHVERNAARMAERADIEARLCPSLAEPFSVDGYCIACHAPTQFRVGYEYGVTAPDGRLLPNWREHLVCTCGLNARTRLALHAFLEGQSGVDLDEPIYVMEQTSALYRWLQRCAPRLIGSEFLGDHRRGGDVIGGVRHEDATRLSFADSAFAHILSLDVFEHVPDYRRAFAECARCLRPGGRLLFTVPFLADSPSTLIRARRGSDGRIEHLLPPEHHGDPMNAGEGILCFQHFGWDMLDDLRAAGFRDAAALFAWSRPFGYLGGEQVLFEAIR
jgi:SAM-dependent methyltransferase